VRIVVGDFWSFEVKSLLAIPTNLGWTRDGMAVMGKGVAKDAAVRCPELIEVYGGFLRKQAGGVRIPWYRFGIGPGYLMLPTKPLDPVEPERSWRQGASLELIERALLSLKETLRWPEIPAVDVALPLLGTGEGGLRALDVIQLMERILPESRFTLVVRQP
jgi:hypothetical protein